MDQQSLALVAAFGSALAFSTASVFFARFAREISSAWMNALKAVLCAAALLVVLVVSGTWSTVQDSSALALVISGALGLGIGDLFLLSAFARIGASRTLMLFGFQPVLVGLASAALFGQPVGPARWLAIGLFMACLFSLSLERYRADGHWELRGLAFALIGVVLDNAGVLLTRWGFEQSPGLNPLQANLIRTGGALIVFFILSFARPFGLWRNFVSLSGRSKALAIAASLGGTFLSLSFYMFAVQNGHLASISAVVLSGPVFSAALECAIQRKAPSPFLVFGLSCLFAGMGLIFLA